MALNPLRQPVGLNALGEATEPFQLEVDAALGRFRTVREDLKNQVRQGELTVKTAREKASVAARELRGQLTERSKDPSPVPRVFLDRLVETANARVRNSQTQSIESLQRETNRLLRMNLIEQQVQTRAQEFQAKVYVRPIAGGIAAPTVGGLLVFHESSTTAGDEPAREWARRQLETLRDRVIDSDDQRRIDLACDRPDMVNPRLIASYAEVLKHQSPDEMETFVTEALTSRDANACSAAFVVARSVEDPSRFRWVRQLLSGLNDFPDQALSSLRAWEAEARMTETTTAQSLAARAVSAAEIDARLIDVQAPTESQLERQSVDRARPIAAWDEPIGLTAQKRWSEGNTSVEEAIHEIN